MAEIAAARDHRHAGEPRGRHAEQHRVEIGTMNQHGALGAEARRQPQDGHRGVGPHERALERDLDRVDSEALHRIEERTGLAEANDARAPARAIEAPKEDNELPLGATDAKRTGNVNDGSGQQGRRRGAYARCDRDINHRRLLKEERLGQRCISLSSVNPTCGALRSPCPPPEKPREIFSRRLAPNATAPSFSKMQVLRLAGWAAAMASALLVPAVAARETCPEQPRAVDTSTEPQHSRRPKRPATSDDLRRALASAAPGAEIVLTQGVEYVGPFILPRQPPGAPYIWIHSDGLGRPGFPAPGKRVEKSQAGSLATMVAPKGRHALLTADGASGYWITGVEIRPAADE